MEEIGVKCDLCDNYCGNRVVWATTERQRTPIIICSTCGKDKTDLDIYKQWIRRK
jgi:hypothetical protein